MTRFIYLISGFGVVLLFGCSPPQEKQEQTLFEKVPSSISNIDFSNDLTVTDSFNIYRDSYFLAGGGVALGDMNNNGLLDIYLTGNQTSNRLYLNKGDFVFEDITESAGVGGSKPWATGVSLADVNGNGFLDIYVTNSGSDDGEERKNELFINNGDLTFSERAEEFGIADSGYSIHAAFFDYDNDGDLDLYLMNNHAYQSHSNYDLSSVDRSVKDHNGGDRFYRNDGSVFTDVTGEAGIYSSEVSFGFGVSVADLNRNGWMDIYISNDFFERDYLYLNNGDGTFREVLEQTLSSTSTTSMGGDIADLDNDGFPEIFVTDMLPETEERIKTITDFIDYEQYQREVDLGFHRKFTRNTLHYNHGNGTFSEIGRFAGVEATDWSWGALIADFDLDGLRDIFVANGFFRDTTDKDYLVRTYREGFWQSVVVDGVIDYEKLIGYMPSTPISNYMFENLGGLRFANRAGEWGLDEPGFSHGSAYGDLNGNGALDLVVNNVNMQADVYRNRAPELHPERSWLQIELAGEAPNTHGVGAQVDLVAGDRYWYVEQMLQRGFMSSMDPLLHVGLGEDVARIDTLQVRWPDGRVSLMTDVNARQRLVIRHDEAGHTDAIAFHDGGPAGATEASPDDPLMVDVTGRMLPGWRHLESDFNDFIWYPLLFHMRSTEGPPVCIGDISGNGLDDFYVGGARGQPGSLYLQRGEGGYAEAGGWALEDDRSSEDVDCIFFDATGDGRAELYVGSGSSEFAAGAPELADRLYRLDDNGELIRLDGALPRPSGGHMPTGVVQAADVDGSGHLDLFVGARLTPYGFGSSQGYGVPAGGYLLKNDGNGRFEDVTGRLAPGLSSGELAAGGITSAAWGDLNGNGQLDLVVAGEWMPLTVFYNRGGRLERADLQEAGLGNTSGWWQSLALADLNGNGRLDIAGGNHGLNSRFRASPEEPVEMWAGDFNRNGQIEQIFASTNDKKGPYPVALRHYLQQQLPYLGSIISSFADYAGQKVTDIFSPEQLESAHYYRAELFESVVAWNNGDGSFHIESLPDQAQWMPVYAIQPFDVTGNGISELLLGGNLDAVQPQAGPYDAGSGLLLRQGADGSYGVVPSQESGFGSDGEIRSIQAIDYQGRPLIITGRNNHELKIFEIPDAQPHKAQSLDSQNYDVQSHKAHGDPYTAHP